MIKINRRVENISMEPCKYIYEPEDIPHRMSLFNLELMFKKCRDSLTKYRISLLQGAGMIEIYIDI